MGYDPRSQQSHFLLWHMDITRHVTFGIKAGSQLHNCCRDTSTGNRHLMPYFCWCPFNLQVCVEPRIMIPGFMCTGKFIPIHHAANGFPLWKWKPICQAHLLRLPSAWVGRCQERELIESPHPGNLNLHNWTDQHVLHGTVLNFLGEPQWFPPPSPCQPMHQEICKLNISQGPKSHFLGVWMGREKSFKDNLYSCQTEIIILFLSC